MRSLFVSACWSLWAGQKILLRFDRPISCPSTTTLRLLPECSLSAFTISLESCWSAPAIRPVSAWADLATGPFLPDLGLSVSALGASTACCERTSWAALSSRNPMNTGARKIPSDVRSEYLTCATSSGLTQVMGPSALPGRTHRPTVGTSPLNGFCEVFSVCNLAYRESSVRSSNPDPAWPTYVSCLSPSAYSPTISEPNVLAREPD